VFGGDLVGTNFVRDFVANPHAAKMARAAKAVVSPGS